MNTPTSTTTPKPGFLSGFNLNSVLLLIVIILLGVVAFKPAPELKQPKKQHTPPASVAASSSPDKSAPAYEYAVAWLKVSDMDFSRQVQEAEERKGTGDKLVFLLKRMNPLADLPWLVEGWEYVGPLCCNGEGYAWILLRRPKP